MSSIDQEKSVTDAELAEIGRDDALHLFKAFDRVKQRGRPVETILLAFNELREIEVLAAETRLREAGLTAVQISIWRDSVVTELNRKLAARAEQKSKGA